MRSRKPINQRVSLDTPEEVERALALIALAIGSPGEYEICIQPKTFRPSPSQRGLYRIWVRQIANHTGNTQAAVHKGLAERYLTTVEVDDEGNEAVVGGSTEDLSTHDMGEYLDWVAYFAATSLGLALDSSVRVHSSRPVLTSQIQQAA